MLKNRNWTFPVVYYFTGKLKFFSIILSMVVVWIRKTPDLEKCSLKHWKPSAVPQICFQYILEYEEFKNSTVCLFPFFSTKNTLLGKFRSQNQNCIFLYWILLPWLIWMCNVIWWCFYFSFKTELQFFSKLEPIFQKYAEICFHD